jgi:hypothetical protein
LLDEIHSLEHPLRDPIRAIAGRDSILIKTQEECRRWVTTARDHASGLCANLSPQIAIPVLMQAATELNFLPAEEKFAWLGRPLKTAVALIGANIYVRRPVQSKSLTRLREAVQAVALFDQLQIVHSAQEVFGDSGDQVAVTPEGIRTTGQTAHALAQFNLAYGDPGTGYRTGADTKAVFFLQPEAAISAVEAVLKGDRPADQAVFHETVFQELPGRESLAFWAGVWVRLKLAMFAAYLRTRVTAAPQGISVFETLFQPATEGLPLDALTASAVPLYWSRRWYYGRVKDRPHRLIVERPVVNVTPNPALYVTSFAHAIQCLTGFIEASVMEYEDCGGAPLPPGTFQKLISTPFEYRAAAAFRRHGFMAGSVNESGIWQLPEGPVTLDHPAGDVSPGQVDVLAGHLGHNAVFVVECKVLGDPLRPNTLRNIAGKVGDGDTEQFFSKLDHKVAWLRRTETFRRLPETCFIRVLLLDRKTPGGMRASPQRSVLDLETLAQTLVHLFGEPAAPPPADQPSAP